MAAHMLLPRNLRIASPSDVVQELKFPDFNQSARPTCDLLFNIAQLTWLRYPSFHHAFTLTVDVVLASLVLITWSVLAWRIRRRSFWILRWQRGHLVPNGVNAVVIIGGLDIMVWLGNSDVLLNHSFQPSVHLLAVALVWILGWAAGWSSVYCIPTATPFGRGKFSAKQLNTFFIAIPVVFCAFAMSCGIVMQVKWSAALSLDHAFREMLRLQPDSAPVTPAQLEEALKVWSSLVSAWSFGSVLFFACGVWALAAALFFLVIHVLLVVELKRQKGQHLAASSAGMAIDPVWTEPGSDSVAMESLSVTMNRLISYQDKTDASGFFPPFKPAPSALTDSANLFRKCLRNIRACSVLSVGSLALVASICLYAAFAASSIRDEDRSDYMRVHLTVQILVGAAFTLGGAAAAHEVITQSLQPVLVASSAHVSSGQTTKVHEGRLGFKIISHSFFNTIGRLPKATSSQFDRMSASSCDTKSMSHRQRLYSSPSDAPEALISLGIQEEGDADNDASHDPTVVAFRRIQSFPDLREGSQPLLRDSVSITSRGTSQPSTLDTEILSYDEARQLRGFPSRAQPTRVHFTRETLTTYETVRPPPRPRRPERPYVPSWRKESQ